MGDQAYEAQLCEYQEGAVHRSSGWCSVDLFRGSRREEARTPPGRIFPDIWCSDTRIRPYRIREIPGYGFPDQIPPLVSSRASR